MRVIPVIDVLQGKPVHARGGDRARYEPVRSALTGAAPDAMMLARAYRDRLGTGALYVADLDAIGGQAISPVIQDLSGISSVWLDAGVSELARARGALATGAALIVIGLETLVRRASLEELVAAMDGERLAFSLDVRGHVPIMAQGSDVPSSVPEIVRWVTGLGVRRIIVLDLERVGSGKGPGLEVLGRVRRAAPVAELVAGGGVRHAGDLHVLASAGCEAALVGTALHAGTVTAADIRTLCKVHDVGGSGE